MKKLLFLIISLVACLSGYAMESTSVYGQDTLVKSAPHKAMRFTQLLSNDVEVYSYEEISIPVFLRNGRDIRDVQFDISIDADVALAYAECHYSDYQLIFSDISSDDEVKTYRVMMVSSTGATIPSDSLTKLCTLHYSNYPGQKNATCRIHDIAVSYSNGSVGYPNDAYSNVNIVDETPYFTLCDGQDMMETSVGQTFTLPLTAVLKNKDIRDMQFDIYIPDGFRVEGFSTDLPGYTAAFDKLPNDDGHYRFVLASLDGAVLAADDSVATTSYLAGDITLFAYEEVYAFVTLCNAVFSASDGRILYSDKSYDVLVAAMSTVEPYILEYDFKQGWNWFSFNISDYPFNYCYDLAYGYLTPTVDYIASQSEEMFYDEEYGWFGYMELSGTKGYKAFATEDVTFEFESYNCLDTNTLVTLVPGWTWIGYLPTQPQMVSTALANYGPEEGDIIKSQEFSAIYHDGVWIGDFEMKPGQGYIYRSNKNFRSYIYYNVLDSYYSPARIAAYSTDGGFFDCDIHQFRDNMTVIARIADADADRYTVGAFFGDECRGKSIADHGYQMLTTHGEQGDALRFAILDTMTGDLYEATDIDGTPVTLDFNGSFLGTPAAPVVLNLGARIGDVATGIRFDTAHGNSGNVYDLDGRRAHRQHGVVVKDGHKTIMK